MEITRLGFLNATQMFLLKLRPDDWLKTRTYYNVGCQYNVTTEISKDSTNEVLELNSNQEEADTMQDNPPLHFCW